ncbi:hypothetical protein AUEXF2481DRAFT_69079 [Aureobasidium subglaciale EXF-2481]|uniref:Zn(2)-C6 fungal-type domain-containing protein n=1 Tax=Aureobasidium subglaciale (strain EXF-2481) TaxID=1043005 RepID=A0A074YD48_AURSE|nr:uncharacterized protein AUEXF2481DRAFT_69079 [Aureobasidium subglaciale EXF-2481]KEQ92052.1 hypothetical protein AUEXF2481DRAFT_69079 [Aureobasidium subglaciale EXF-2481]
MQTTNCDRCYRRKSKCDRLQPCASCSKSEAQCVYTDRTKERAVRPDVVDRLERRLAQAENRNKSLAAELSRIRSARSHASNDNADTNMRPEPPSDDITSRRDDIAAQVSILSTSAAGERQYLGSTSGVLFADLVRASVDVPHSRHPSPPTTARTEYSPESSDDVRVELPRELPSRKLAQKLIQAYLDHDFLCYPFLIPSEIHRTLDYLYNSGLTSLSCYELFVVDMLFAISTAQVSKYDWRQLPSAESHHARAMASIGDVLRFGGLQSLHAILLLCQYRTGSSIQDNSGSMWLLVGIAARMCFEMGLHKESAFPLTGPGNDDTTSKRYLLQESKRRSFWSVLCMDRITSLILGRPCAIRDDDFDHACPFEDSTISPPETDVGGSKPFVFKHIVSYRLLCGEIVSALHRKKAPNVGEQHVLDIRHRLCADLEGWKHDVENLHLEQNSQTSSSCHLSTEWYSLLYSNAMLILWRPSPLLPDISHDARSLQHIFDSAKQSITIYASLHKSRKINYSWITLQSVFLAGLSYVYACGRHYRSRWRNPTEPSLQKDPSTIEVVNDTRACSNVLVAVSERWNALRNCHEVFDKLSDAVLSDAIKLQTAQAQQMIRPFVQQSVNINNDSLNHNNLITPRDSTTFSPLAVDTEFLHCFDDLQQLYNMQQIEDPIMELSQDWLGYLGNGSDFIEPSYQMNGY